MSDLSVLEELYFEIHHLYDLWDLLLSLEISCSGIAQGNWVIRSGPHSKKFESVGTTLSNSTEVQIMNYTFSEDPAYRVWYQVNDGWVPANAFDTSGMCGFESLTFIDPTTISDEITGVSILSSWGIQLDGPIDDATQIWQFITWMIDNNFSIVDGTELSSNDWVALYDAVNTLIGYQIPLTGNPWEPSQIIVLRDAINEYATGLLDRFKELPMYDQNGNPLPITVYEYLCQHVQDFDCSNSDDVEVAAYMQSVVFSMMFEEVDSTVAVFRFKLVSGNDDGIYATSSYPALPGEQPGQTLTIEPGAFTSELVVTVAQLIQHEITHRFNALHGPEEPDYSETFAEDIIAFAQSIDLDDYNLTTVPSVTAREGFTINAGQKTGEPDTLAEQYTDAILNWLLDSFEAPTSEDDPNYRQFWMDAMNEIVAPIISQQIHSWLIEHPEFIVESN